MPTLLVVDAGAAFGLSLNRSLRRYGYDVRLATSADHAVRTIQARHIDFLIVHDEGMGRGRAALACVRGLNRVIPSALITSEHVSEGRQQIVDDAGPVSVFGKPLDLTQVVAAIERALVPAAPIAAPLCRIALADQKTRHDLRRVDPSDHPTRREMRALPATRRVPTVMEAAPEPSRSRRPTVKTRALDAGEYSFVNRRRAPEARCNP